MIGLATLKEDGQTRSKVRSRALAPARGLRGNLFVTAKQLQQGVACKPFDSMFSCVLSREIQSYILDNILTSILLLGIFTRCEVCKH